MVFGDREYRGYVGVGWHNNLVALPHPTKGDQGAKRECEGIESVGAAHAVLCSAILGIFRFKRADSLSLEIPSAVHHVVHGLSYLVGMHRRDAFQFEIIYFHAEAVFEKE